MECWGVMIPCYVPIRLFFSGIFLSRDLHKKEGKPVAAAGLSKRGSSFSGNIIKMYHLFIRKFCPTFLFKIML